jgi:group I intron endonuclease
VIIYRITNTINGKVYIGRTIQPLAHRWQQHVQDVRRYTFPLHNAIRKYGTDGFTAEVVHHAKTREELRKMETFFIILHQSHKPENGYNMTLGGDGGEVPNAATRVKMSRAHKGKKSSPEANVKRSARMIDFYANPEHRKQTGIYGLGREVSRETRDKIGQSNLGKNKDKHPSPETLVKMRLAQLGRKRTPEQCINVKAAAQNRRQISAEAHQRMSLAARKRKRTPFSKEARKNMREAALRRHGLKH